MSDELEKVALSMFNNKVRSSWWKVSSCALVAQCWQ